MRSLMDWRCLVDLAVYRCDWMAGFHHPVVSLRCGSYPCGRHCFFDHPKWFGQDLDHLGHDHCDPCCLSFRYACEPFSLPHSIFGHQENSQGSTEATFTKQTYERRRKTKRNVKIWSYWTKQAIIIGIWCSPCSLSNSERIQDLHRWWNHSSAVLVRQGFLVRVSNGFVDQPRCQIVQTWFSTLLPLQYEVHFLRTADGCHWIGLRCLIFVLNHTK